MNMAIDMCIKPRIGLLYFERYESLRDWIKASRNEIIMANGIYNVQMSTIRFPNGNVLMLGHGDINRYLGCEFMFVLGCPQLQHRVRI